MSSIDPKELVKEYKVLGASAMTVNEIRQLVGLEPISDLRSTARNITNCKNCGAPLTKNKYCEYCGAQY